MRRADPYKARERQRQADLARHGGDRIALSIEQHEARLQRAVDAKDYATMRDAGQVLASLRAMRGKS